MTTSISANGSLQSKTKTISLFELRKEFKQKFAELDIDTEDADFIIAEVLNTRRTELILIDYIDEDEESLIREKCGLRMDFVPVDKIFKKAYFYGLEFEVDKNVLSPRPESELLVEKALEYIHKNNYATMLDLCTGSGCLSIAIKKNVDVKILATDVSQKAITIAKRNAKANNVDVDFLRSDMFEKIEGCFDIIISNPPYIDTDEMKDLDLEVLENDPRIALDGGEMGLKFYNIIHNNLRKHLNENGVLILEIGDDQKDLIVSLFNDFQLLESLTDYSGNDRVLIFKK